MSLVFGDRDYACPWNGGEAVSLAVNYSSSAQFRAAGYQDIRVNETYVGGQVRQHGNFSFVRVYDAGHEGTSSVFCLFCLPSRRRHSLEGERRSSFNGYGIGCLTSRCHTVEGDNESFSLFVVYIAGANLSHTLQRFLVSLFSPSYLRRLVTVFLLSLAPFICWWSQMLTCYL